MPLYDYVCAACGRRFEVIHGLHDSGPTSCPLCGKGPVRKAFAAPAIHFKGSGWAKKERRAGKSGSGSSGGSKSDDSSDAGAASGSGSEKATGGKSGGSKGGSSSGGTDASSGGSDASSGSGGSTSSGD